MTTATRSGARLIALNLIVLLAAYALLVVLVQFADRLSIRVLPNLFEAVAAIGGLLLARRMRVREVTYLFWGVLAYGLATTVMHALFGVASVQGREVRFAIMIAAAMGVAFGAWNRHRGIAPAQ